MIDSTSKMGFQYLVEVLRDGVVIDTETVHNLLPLEGLNYLLASQFKGTAVPATWSLGVFIGDYTPTSGDTAASLPGAAVETTSYNELTRIAFVPGTVAGGAIDNVASPALFTFNATQTVYGGFMSSSSVKGSGAGTLLSSVRFASPKALDSGTVLRLTAGFTFASV